MVRLRCQDPENVCRTLRTQHADFRTQRGEQPCRRRPFPKTRTKTPRTTTAAQQFRTPPFASSSSPSSPQLTTSSTAQDRATPGCCEGEAERATSTLQNGHAEKMDHDHVSCVVTSHESQGQTLCGKPISRRRGHGSSNKNCKNTKKKKLSKPTRRTHGQSRSKRWKRARSPPKPSPKVVGLHPTAAGTSIHSLGLCLSRNKGSYSSHAWRAEKLLGCPDVVVRDSIDHGARPNMVG